MDYHTSRPRRIDSRLRSRPDILDPGRDKYLRELGRDAFDRLSAAIATPGIEHAIATQLAQQFNVNYDKYDRAIDAVYNRVRTGGSTLHHNLDGAHTFDGAFGILHDAFPNEPAWHLRVEGLEHLARDFTTPSGINPFLSPDQFQTAKDALLDIGLTKKLANDLLNVNASEILGTVLGMGVVVLRWNDARATEFAEQIARLGSVGFFAGDPVRLAFASALLLRAAASDVAKMDEVIADLAVGLTEGWVLATMILSPFSIGASMIAGVALARGLRTLVRGGHTTAVEMEGVFTRLFPAYRSYLSRL